MRSARFLTTSKSIPANSMTLRRAITTLTQSLPDGTSKVVSRVARDHGLPRLTWSTFGLSSSPRSIQEIARDEGCMRSLGEQVRLIDEVHTFQQSRRHLRRPTAGHR